jgi:hypothetical protein
VSTSDAPDAQQLGCELCAQPGGVLLFKNAEMRVVAVGGDEGAAYPGFCRVIWRAHVREMTDLDEAARARRRHWVHVGFAAVLLAVILGFRAFNDASVISTVLKIAGYTYGPLLGLFVLGLTTRFAVRDRWVPVLCFLAPGLCWLLDRNSEAWFGGYKFGFELLMLNGLLTAAGILAVARRREAVTSV